MIPQLVDFPGMDDEQDWPAIFPQLFVGWTSFQNDSAPLPDFELPLTNL